MTQQQLGLRVILLHSKSKDARLLRFRDSLPDTQPVFERPKNESGGWDLDASHNETSNDQLLMPAGRQCSNTLPSKHSKGLWLITVLYAVVQICCAGMCLLLQSGVRSWPSHGLRSWPSHGLRLLPGSPDQVCQPHMHSQCRPITSLCAALPVTLLLHACTGGTPHI